MVCFPILLNTSASIFCESIAFFVVKACQRRVAFSKLPRVLHHKCEVVVSVDGATDTFVVLAELLEGDDSVSLLAVPLGHEFMEDLVGRLFALLNIGVLARIVDLSDVLQGHLAILSHIQLVVGQSDPLLAFVVDFSLLSQNHTESLE